MWEYFHEILKSDEVQILAILSLYVMLAYVIKQIHKLSTNHFVHTDAAIAEVKEEIKTLRGEVMGEIRSINEYLRGQ